MIRAAGVIVGLLSGVLAESAFAADDPSPVIRAQMQSLMDGVSAGDASAWRALLDDRAVMIDEAGGRYGKAELVAQVTPLPGGVSGTIVVTDWKLTVFGNVAVDTHTDDEHEDFHGQKLHALYLCTDTWLKTTAGWRLISGQTLALRQDPLAVALPPAALDAYVGRYSAAPDYIYEISREGSGLAGRTNGGKPQPLLAELADVLFTPGQPRTRKIFQRGPDGRITGFLSRREERDVVFRKVE